MAPKQRKAGSVKTLPDRNEQRVLDLSKKEIDVRVKRWNAFVAAQLANPQQRFVMENFLRANAKIEEFMTVPCSHGHAHKPDCKVCNAELYDLNRRAEAIGFSLDMQKEPPPDDPVERREWIMSLRSQTVSDLNYVALSTGEPASELMAKSPYVQWCDIELELLDKSAGALPKDTQAPVVKVAQGMPAATEVAIADGTSVPIQWKGSVQVLAWLLGELANMDWIDAPRHSSTTTRYKAGDINASRFAKAMAPHFQGVNLTTLDRELKPGGASVPAQDVEEFRIPKRPQ